MSPSVTKLGRRLDVDPPPPPPTPPPPPYPPPTLGTRCLGGGIGIVTGIDGSVAATPSGVSPDIIIPPIPIGGLDAGVLRHDMNASSNPTTESSSPSPPFASGETGLKATPTTIPASPPLSRRTDDGGEQHEEG
jgi:hypothetical protein